MYRSGIVYKVAHEGASVAFMGGGQPLQPAAPTSGTRGGLDALSLVDCSVLFVVAGVTNR